METEIKLSIKVQNEYLYEKLNQIMKSYQILPKKGGFDNEDNSFLLLGKDGKKMYFSSVKSMEAKEINLFPKNLYDVSPFLFLYLLRSENYPLEVFYEIRQCFLENFPKITDSYEYVKIDSDYFGPVQVDESEKDGYQKHHNSLLYQDGKLLYSTYSDIQTEEIPTPAESICKMEKIVSKVENDAKLYKSALDAFQIEGD